MTEYDINKALHRIENGLIASMFRNLKRHRVEEISNEKEWAMWQAKQLQSLEAYRKNNVKEYQGVFKEVNDSVDTILNEAYKDGALLEEAKILKATKQGYQAKSRPSKAISNDFFQVNERKLNALTNATTNDMKKAQTAVLRRANDQYRKIIYDAQVYANTGAGTYEKAVDMATKDFLARGIDCIEYKNGARHNISDYSRMAIRTASKRAYLQGEGAKRQELGEHLVRVNKRTDPCPKCLPFCGKVFIDDVWSGGKKGEANYPLLSSAINAGLYHPNCKCVHSTYFEGISRPGKNTYSKQEIKQLEDVEKLEAQESYARRQEEKYSRLAKYSLDEENQNRYRDKKEFWKNRRVRFKTEGLPSKEYVKEKRLEEARKRFSSITQDKFKSIQKPTDIIDLHEYKTQNVVYKVDNKNVVLDYSEKEKQVAQVIVSTLGGQIKMVPRVLNPKGISTPDYIFNGVAFDLKEIVGKSKNVVYNAISKKKKQASNFILDISNCPLDEEEIDNQIALIFLSEHTLFVEKIILIANNTVKRIYKRNK